MSIPKTMKAAVSKEYGKPLVIRGSSRSKTG